MTTTVYYKSIHENSRPPEFCGNGAFKIRACLTSSKVLIRDEVAEIKTGLRLSTPQKVTLLLQNSIEGGGSGFVVLNNSPISKSQEELIVRVRSVVKDRKVIVRNGDVIATLVIIKNDDVDLTIDNTGTYL